MPALPLFDWSAAKADKAFWHNFDVLYSKMLVTMLDFGYKRINALTCSKEKVGQLSSFTGKEEHVMMVQFLFVFQGVRY